MCLHVTALRDTMALHVNTSTPVHDLHASTIPHVQTSRVPSTCAFVNQDIQVRAVLKPWLRMMTVGKQIELYYLYNFPSIITVTKLRSMRWVNYVAPFKEKRNAQKVLVEKTKEVDHLYKQSVNGRVIINWILKKLKGGCGLNSSLSGQEPLSSTQIREFLY